MTSVRRLEGNPQFGHGGTNEGPQGRVQSKFLLDIPSTRRIMRGSGSDAQRKPLYDVGREHGDETVEKEELVFAWKRNKVKTYTHNGFAYGLSSLNNCEAGADAVQYFPDDVEAQKDYVMQNLRILGWAFDRLDQDEKTGGLPGTGMALTVAGTVPVYAQENLAPGELVRAVPPDPKLYGRWKRRHGISGTKATLELVPFKNETAEVQWERMWRMRYKEREDQLQGREDRRAQSEKYEEFLNDYKTCTTFENAFVMNGIMFMAGLARAGIIEAIRFTDNNNFFGLAAANGGIIGVDARAARGVNVANFNTLTGDDFAKVLSEGLAHNFGLIKGAAPPDVNTLMEGTKLRWHDPKLRMLNSAFFTDATDKGRYFYSEMDSRLQSQQREWGKRLNLCFSQLNSVNKASIFGKVIKPADAGTNATVLRMI